MGIADGERWSGDEEPVELVPYDPAWPERFAAEAELLEGAIGGFVEGGIHHVGSTAVPGLSAKPVIDIMVGIRDLEEARQAFPLLAALGYQYFPYQGWMHWFCKTSPARRTHHLHLVPHGDPHFRERLAFRDHLRQPPAVALEYARLKFDLARRYRHDREAYTDGKTEFVASVVRAAAIEAA
jgi:GrpB-like predicted nucleotidyltransferase (UPF0157 family)